MPSQRKRIGFLPRANVQDIIDQICEHNELSQSRVTGILVEEALSYRGLLSRTISNKNSSLGSNNSNSLSFKADNLSIDYQNANENINLNESYFKNEIEMINDFIEFKFFKKIMRQSKAK